MKSKWHEVARLRFRGKHVRDNALDLAAAVEIASFQKLIMETVKTLWRADHPDRERLPKGFEKQVELYFRAIEPGSAVIPLGVFVEAPPTSALFDLPEEPTEIDRGIDLVQQVFEALEKQKPLPSAFPRSLVPNFEPWGQSLDEGDEMELITRAKKTARITPAARIRLQEYSKSNYEDHVNVTGEVLEANVRTCRFQLWVTDEKSVEVIFTPEQEILVTEALRDHRVVRLHVAGLGMFSPEGKLLKVTEVQAMEPSSVGQKEYDKNARAIEDELRDLASTIPQQELEKLPNDLSENLDHYIYGKRKKPRDKRLC